MNYLKKTLLFSLLILIVASIAFVGYRFYQIKQSEAPHQTILFDDIEINYSEAKVSYDVIGPYFKTDVNYAVDSVLTKIHVNNVNHSINALQQADIKVMLNDVVLNDVVEGHQLMFRENGFYVIEVKIDDQSMFTQYYFEVDVQLEPNIQLPDLTSYQGGILYFQIDNAPLNSEVSVISDFSESNIYQSENTISFYIPMWYAAKVKQYPLTIKLNENTYDYMIDLQAYEFRELHFSVPASTVTSTVGDPNATPQYKEVIYPTYESAIDQVYWQGNFIMPVLDAKITSYFGDMRFVNNATTATRHAGIDYAIDCKTDVVAANGGEVIVSQALIITGNTIVIDHGLGLKTYYEHMDDLSVSVGDIVEKGQIIGHVGTTGYSTGCHLHFQSMIKNQSFNPDSLYTWMD